jgi:hypothetical protein
VGVFITGRVIDTTNAFIVLPVTTDKMTEDCTPQGILSSCASVQLQYNKETKLEVTCILIYMADSQLVLLR